ncbi:MAG TPA: adenosine deaminase [Dehalococcoidia bacterium]|nr:adenosine deaminase [Dehalococcoidia bacterium]
MTDNSNTVDDAKARDTWFDKVPKVELHLHLEGAIPHNALWELIQKYGGEPSVPNLQALVEKFKYRDFLHFMETWVWKNQFLREYEDFTFISEAVARDLADQNVLYAETFFAPSDFARHGLGTQKLAEAIRAGLSKVPEVEIALVADLVRSRKLEDASSTLAEINEVRELGVIGITIGGSEQAHPPGRFADIYERARQLGFHTSAHAGEAAGPESIWGAIHSLKVERIGHGTRAFEDDSLVDYIASHKIPLEVCLISNVRTCVVESIAKHPICNYFDRGIIVTINTDDPKMFNTSLAEEYRALEGELGFSREEVRGIILQGVEASWLSEDRKIELVKSFREHPDW